MNADKIKTHLLFWLCFISAFIGVYRRPNHVLLFLK
jgi:hypothetical protein